MMSSLRITSDSLGPTFFENLLQVLVGSDLKRQPAEGNNFLKISVGEDMSPGF